MKCQVVFQPWGKRCRAAAETTVLRLARAEGVEIASFCGDNRKCGKCKIRVLSQSLDGKTPALSPLTEAERALLTEDEIKAGYRLACCAAIEGDAVIEVPPESRSKKAVILDDGAGEEITFNPAVRCYNLRLEKPDLQDNRDDLTRLIDALAVQNPCLKELTIDFKSLQTLPRSLREGRFEVTALVLNDTEIIGVLPGKDAPVFGMAVDVGTTTLAAYLCDLKTGALLEKASAVNPQIRYGDDVLSRVSHCMMHREGLADMQRQLMEALNTMAAEMTQKQAGSPGQIAETVLVFNTVMEHIALGITPEALGVSPFISGARRGLNIKGGDLGLRMMAGGNVYCPPSEAGFIGSDNTAVLIAREPYKQDKVQLIIDIGTNGEICLGNAEALYVTSCATGPALEGAQIKCGMRAAEGAVEHVEIDAGSLEPSLKIIGKDRGSSGEAAGICGSGIIDAVAQLAAVGIIDPDGNFDKTLEHPRIRKDAGGKWEYVLAFQKNGQDIVITQKDIRAVQLAKAALYAGAKLLLKRSPFKRIDEIILAGAFGSYIDVGSALALGLFPDCPADQIKVVGNAAGVGARMALLNREKRREAETVSASVHFIESAADEDFYTEFGNAMGIPHKTDLFTQNLPGSFPCSGKDERQIPGELCEMVRKSHENPETMAQAACRIRELEKLPAVRLPLDLTTETRVFGGDARWNGAELAPGRYVCETPEDLEALCRKPLEARVLHEILDCLPRLRENPVILDVQGPFSILASLMDPAILFRYLKPEKEKIEKMLDRITDFLVDYTMVAVERGVKVISFADPAGALEMTGPAVYRAFSGLYTWRFFGGIEPFLDRALVHLCGKAAVSMEKTAYLRARPLRAPETGYLESLLALAEKPRIKFVGGGCINTSQRMPVLKTYEVIQEG